MNSAWRQSPGLLDFGADINIIKKNRMTPFFIAVYRGRTEIVQWLLDNKKTNIHWAFSYATSPLIIASHQGHLDIVKLLLFKYGDDVNQIDNRGYSPLIVALMNGHIQIAFMLLEKGANVNQQE